MKRSKGYKAAEAKIETEPPVRARRGDDAG